MVGLSSARAAFSGGLGELDHLTGAQPATIEAGIDRRDVAPSPCVMEKLGGDAAQSIARRNGVGTGASLRGRGDRIWRRDPFRRLRLRASGDLGLCWCVSHDFGPRRCGRRRFDHLEVAMQHAHPTTPGNLVPAFVRCEFDGLKTLLDVEFEVQARHDNAMVAAGDLLPVDNPFDGNSSAQKRNGLANSRR